MKYQITPAIEMLTDEVEILAFIHDNPALEAQVEQPDIRTAQVDMVLPYIMRGKAPHWFDLLVLVRHGLMEETGRWVLYRTEDFARRQTDLGKLVHTLVGFHRLSEKLFLDTIRAQIKLLNQPEYADFTVVPAQMIRHYMQQNPRN